MSDHRIFDWEGTSFVSSSHTTPTFKKFARDFRYGLKHLLGDNYEVEGWNRGHFYVSGFIRNKETDKFAYFSTSDVRFFKDEWLNNILVRTAEDVKDYSGGTNNFCKLTDIESSVRRLTQ